MTAALPKQMLLDKPTAELKLDTSTISLEERNKLQEERERMYQMLDEKDDEIQEQSQLVSIIQFRNLAETCKGDVLTMSKCEVLYIPILKKNGFETFALFQ